METKKYDFDGLYKEMEKFNKVMKNALHELSEKIMYKNEFFKRIEKENKANEEEKD